MACHAAWWSLATVLSNEAIHSLQQQKQWGEASTSGDWILGYSAVCLSMTCHVGWCFLTAMGIDEAVSQVT